MAKLHQKKFYSSPEVDKVIEQHAEDRGWGFSEALRHIVLDWAGELVTIPKAGIIDGDKIQLNKYWNSPDGIEQSR